MDDTLEVVREIAAPAEQVWAMVADVTRMGEWSPENEGGEWIGGASGPTSGARFRSRNRVGKRSWKTVATVTDAEPGRRFAFRVTAGPVPVADWAYAFEPTASGCRVTETWTDRRPGWFVPIAKLATGVRDRASHNRQGMTETLERLATVAESTPASS